MADKLRFEIDTVPQWAPQRLRSAPLAGAAALDVDVRARWWWGRGRLAVGAGADWTASTTPAPLGSTTGPGRPRFALEFRTKAVSRDLRDSLLRVQLSGDAALHFRPRSRGLQITYRERF